MESMESKASNPLAEAYLDIETTGLSHEYDDITVVGIYVCIGDNTELFQFSGDEINAGNLLNALHGVSDIYTYNGRSFDLPFIRSRLGTDLTVMFKHHDLMDNCHRYNLYGGCKEAERILGIERQLKEIDGLAAIKLWQKYKEENDENAFCTLCEYNKEDVLTLKTMKEKLIVFSNTTDEKKVSSKYKKQRIENVNSLSITISIKEREDGELTLAGLEFVITGTLKAFSRGIAHECIRALGGTAKDNVTRKTSYLVVGEDPGESKIERARTLGTEQINEERFLAILEQKN